MSSTKDLSAIRHSFAHLLAAAVLKIRPEALPTIGPAIDDGFYYDFDFPTPLGEAELPHIEKEMKEILKQWKGFSHREVSADEAKKIFKDNPYKLELIEEIASRGEKITLYKSGDFEDLCRGGHVEDIKELNPDAFVLTSLAGAYWRGSEKNKMLTRVYALAFDTKEALEEHRTMLEEAKKRDHRKIGQEQELFLIDEMVGKGLVLWLPNGTIMRDEIEKLAVEKEKAHGYVRVSTPHIAKEELFLTSGHLPYYKDGMYPPMQMDDGTYYLKAMNCPPHHRIYVSKPRSYRNLPLRLAEYGTVYRNELSGTLAGLLRVRALAMNDAHIYCRKDQIEDEFKAVMQLVMDYFELFGLKDYWFRLSKWDPAHKEKYIDEPKNWEYSEAVLRKVLTEMNVPFKEVEDEAAFYGPKVDVQFRSIIGREETMSTIQLDFLAKERFGLNYTDQSGQKNNEVFVIHRAPLSTHERFMAFLIEHYGGAFPTWLSPVQVKVLAISEAHHKYADDVYEALKAANIRAEVDLENESLGKKIRAAKLQKIPYLLVIGDKEVESKMVTVESRDKGNLGSVSTEDFIKQTLKEIVGRK